MRSAAYNHASNHRSDEVLLRLQKKQATNKATKRNQNSLYNAIRLSQSMSSGETLWIRDRDDLLALAKDAENGWFNGILGNTLGRLSRKITLVGIYTSFLIPDPRAIAMLQDSCSLCALSSGQSASRDSYDRSCWFLTHRRQYFAPQSRRKKQAPCHQ